MPPTVDGPSFDQALLDAVPIAAYLCDIDGTIIGYNRPAAELWGEEPRPVESAKGFAAPFRFTHLDGTCVADAETPLAEALQTGKAVHGREAVVDCQNGKRVRCIIDVTLLRNPLGQVVGAMTCLQKATNATRAGEIPCRPPEPSAVPYETQRRFRDLLEALPAAIYTTDHTGRVTFFNQTAVDVLGRQPELGTDRWCVSWRLHRPDGTPLPHEDCPMAVALKEDRPIRGVEVIAERPDGTLVNLLPYPTPLHDGCGALVGAVNMLVDITERKRAEEAVQALNETLEQRVEEPSREIARTFAELRASEERFRMLVQGVTDYAIFMLDPKGIVTNWNAGAARIKGYSSEEIVGRHFSQFYTENDRRDRIPERALETARRTGKFEAEGYRVRKDGTRFWASVVIDAIHDGSGELIGFAKITRDLTERKAAEEHLRQSQKMEAVGQLTGGVAHDFNNLLTAIIGNLEMIASLLPAGDPGRRYAEGALRAASRGSRLTEHLLAFSRRQEARLETVSINELLREALVLYQKTVGDGVQLALGLEDEIWPCHIDPAQFGAAVLNLAANARDAMGGSGRLTLRTENVTAGGVDASDLAAGEYVVLSASDTGCGMSAEVMNRAFEPFYTTKEVGKGTGLGLSQVYGFAKQSGGAARIESKLGQGTTVRVYLPRGNGKVSGDIAATDSLADLPTAAATILVVEDDEDVREMIVGILSDLGYRTLVATTGPEALAILRRESTVDLLFTDIVMPAGMTGTELARRASQIRPGLKVLLSSGYTREDVQSHPVRGEFPFIAKPYRPTTLSQKLRQVLSGRFLARTAYGD
jgi:PAS domain S-box-containing protein